MKRVFIIALAFLNAPGLYAQSAGSTGLLQGSVVNKTTGAPVKHARIKYAVQKSAVSTNGSVSGTDTDSSGNFAIQLQPGSYRLWVERDGFAKYVYGARTAGGEGVALAVSAGQQIRDLNIRMTPLGAISGRVLDDEGEPLQGVTVQVLRSSYQAGRRSLNPVTGASSNDRGEFRAYGLPAGTYYLMATPIDAPTVGTYYPSGRDAGSATAIPLAEGGDLAGIDFRLTRIRTFTVRGRLLSPIGFDGSRLQAVLAHDDAGAASYIGRQSVQVDRGTGVFEFRGVAPGAYWVVGSQLSASHGLGGRVLLDVSDTAPPGNVSVPLMPGFSVGGKVDMEGGNLPDVKVELIPTEGLTLGSRPTGAVGPGGSIALNGVTPGIWELAVGLPDGVCLKSAMLNDLDLLREELNLAGDPRGLLRIVLTANCSQISGAVVGENGQPHSATVVLAPSEPKLRRSRQMYAVAVTQDGGSFVLHGIRPGSYKLFALEEVEPFEWLNPEVLQRIDSRAESVSLAEGERATRRLLPIPPEALLPNP